MKKIFKVERTVLETYMVEAETEDEAKEIAAEQGDPTSIKVECERVKELKPVRKVQE